MVEPHHQVDTAKAEVHRDINLAQSDLDLLLSDIQALSKVSEGKQQYTVLVGTWWIRRQTGSSLTWWLKAKVLNLGRRGIVCAPPPQF